MRRLTAALIVLMAVPGAARAEAPALCAALSIPDQLGLTCRAATDTAEGGVVIQPESGSFSSLSRMTVRPLDPVTDALAWSDPEAWLRHQLVVDTSGVAGALDEMTDDPDSPFGSSMLKDAVGALVKGLGSLAKAPLAACEEPATRTRGRYDMSCVFGADGLGLDLLLRLQAAGDKRYGLSMRTMNEQRLLHFRAIADGFAPG